METLQELLRASLWTRSLGPEPLERVAAETLVRDFPAGGYVCRKGDRVDYWIGLVDGLLKLTNVSADGHATTLAGITSGSWFGEGSMLKTGPRLYDVVALRASRVALMPRATFTRLLDTEISFNRFLLVQLNERLGQFIAMVESERLHDPEARVAHSLAALFNPVLYPEGALELQISQEEIGYLSGVSRQRVNQALQVLERAGLLAIEYGHIRILDLDGLRDFHR